MLTVYEPSRSALSTPKTNQQFTPIAFLHSKRGDRFQWKSDSSLLLSRRPSRLTHNTRAPAHPPPHTHTPPHKCKERERVGEGKKRETEKMKTQVYRGQQRQPSAVIFLREAFSLHARIVGKVRQIIPRLHVFFLFFFLVVFFILFFIVFIINFSFCLSVN